MFLEKDMQEILAHHPEIIEPGMQFSKKEEVLYGRRIDLLLKDRDGKDVVVELKNTEITYEHIGQLIWYAGALMRAGLEKPRMFLIGRKVHPVLQTVFETIGIEWREYQPEQLVTALKELDSSLYSSYEHFQLTDVSTAGKFVSVAPKTTTIALDEATLNADVTSKFKDRFLHSHIPIQKIGPYVLVFNDKVEPITKGVGNWVGYHRRFSIVNDNLICEGTVYFGTSGTAGAEHYMSGEAPQYLALDIGESSKKGEPFQTGNHTYCLKMPLHQFVEFPSGAMNVEVPIKGPGMKELKGFIHHTLNEWEIETSFHVSTDFDDSKVLWEIAKSIVCVGLLKQIGKKRIIVSDGQIAGG